MLPISIRTVAPKIILGYPCAMKIPFALVAGLLYASSALAQTPEVGQFDVQFTSEMIGEGPGDAFTGEVFIAFSERGEPRRAMHGWFNAPPVMRFHVEGVVRGQTLRLSLPKAIRWHPADLGEQGLKKWKVQAVARLSKTGRSPGISPGDLHSKEIEVSFQPGSDGVIGLSLDQVAEARPFEETDRIKYFEFVSPSLSEFHGFPYPMQAGVLLPRDYDPEKKYPVLYSVTGFGGTYHGINGWSKRIAADNPLSQCIVVVPDANAPLGHTVFCDSANNGPWGKALVHEFIPALEKKFGGAGADQRYVTGVSSGGWSSLWLQVTYPDQFNGCWSHVPDPSDFHDFQQINLYKPLAEGKARSMYVDEAGEPRPLARRDGKVFLTYQDFAEREHVINPGGQLHSFEATFSPRLEDGSPQRIFDIESGQIHHGVAEHWRQYDISHTLLTRWDELEASLSGKIHIYAGEVDTFYLEGAVERFHGLAEKQGLLEHMVVEIIPGMAHSPHAEGWAGMEKVIEAGMAEAAGK